MIMSVWPHWNGIRKKLKLHIRFTGLVFFFFCSHFRQKWVKHSRTFSESDLQVFRGQSVNVSHSPNSSLLANNTGTRAEYSEGEGVWVSPLPTPVSGCSLSLSHRTRTHLARTSGLNWIRHTHLLRLCTVAWEIPCYLYKARGKERSRQNWSADLKVWKFTWMDEELRSVTVPGLSAKGGVGQRVRWWHSECGTYSTSDVL